MKRNANDGSNRSTAATFRKLKRTLTPTRERRHPCQLLDSAFFLLPSSFFLLPLLLAAFTAIGVEQSPAGAPAKSEPIPMDQIGAVAGKQYQGDGLSVAATPDGARLRCVFQKLEGQATREGLWLASTTDDSKGERFRVVAMGVGRVTPCAPGEFRDGDGNTGAHGVTRPTALFPRTGQVVVSDNVVRFMRSGVTEEYSVSMDGVRQDFVVLERPEGAGQLRVELDVSGARAEALVNGARLVLDGSGRKIAYSRLRATDAAGKELTARIEVGRALRCAPTEVRDGESSNGAHGVRALPAKLAVVVDDADAVYPVRIDPTFSDANWISMGGLPGANLDVYAMVADGAGNLYIGGNFTVVGNTNANYIAKWNGSTWSPVGLGMNAIVESLATSGSELYAGGRFTSAGGVAANYIAKWDGSSWSALGSGMNSYGYVKALTVSGGNLYAGGEFTTAGGLTVNYIAKWDGANWSALGSGMDYVVYALAVSGSDLYAGGWFKTAGGSAANYVAKWNGSSWSAVGLGVNAGVGCLAVSGSDVYVGGAFTRATNSGGVAITASRIAKWSGSAWTALGSGMNTDPIDLAVSGSDLYAGGGFTMAGGVLVNHTAKWNGSSWSPVGMGMNDQVNALAVSSGNLFAAGAFTMATNSGGVAVMANYVAKWNATNWSALGPGMNGQVNALAVSGSDLYAGGLFRTAGGNAANYIAKWDGSGWSALGSGMNNTVWALAVSGSNVYAGGYFTTAGGNPASRIARWNGSSWSAVGLGLNNYVKALAVSGSNLYVGGSFTSATNSVGGAITANRIARWNGSSWSALGAGMDNNYVNVLALAGNDLYAGGWFTTAGGVSAANIAKWDGANWSALGAGLDNQAYALAVSGTNLYVGGSFNTAGETNANYVALWDGNSWSALGAGLNYYVQALALSGSDLYAGGWFTSAGGNAANYVAKWDGASWSAPGSGMNPGSSVLALAASGSDLYAGGYFMQAGGKVSAYVARADIGGSVIAAGGRFSNPAYSQSAGFSFIFSEATAGQPYRVRVSPSLTVGSWTDLTNFTYTGPITITDSSAVGPTNRFYRAVSP